MQEIKRYRCIKECSFEVCDGDGFTVDNEYKSVYPGSVWQECECLIAGGPDNIHLDREDGESKTAEWCELSRETLAEWFEQIESIYV